MARLNITFNGLSADYPLELDAQVTDADVRRIALELVRAGGTGQHAPETFDNFVVDRMQDGQQIYLRPKVPFGA